MNDLSLKDLRDANERRAILWRDGKVADDVPLEFALVELAGETGEACNVGKKLARTRLGIKGGVDDSALEHLADELADVVICADLAAIKAGIDLNAAVRRKFNATSDKHGFDVKL